MRKVPGSKKQSVPWTSFNDQTTTTTPLHPQLYALPPSLFSSALPRK